MIRKIILQLGKAISEQDERDTSKLSLIKEIYLSHMVDRIKPLNADEILFLAKSFNKGETTNLNEDAITAILSSPESPVEGILRLENFSDSLLTLKIDLAKGGINHKLSFYDDLYINGGNFKEVLLDTDSIKLSAIDIDYIFAIAFMLDSKVNNKNISSILERCIKDTLYDYLSYFTTEGIISAEILGLDIGDNESSLSYEVNVKGIFAGFKSNAPEQ